MANDAQTLALAQMFYGAARFSTADRRAQTVSRIQVALNEFADSLVAPIEQMSIEQIARALCEAEGGNPDQPSQWGQPRLMRGGRGFNIYDQGIQPAWTQYCTLAESFARLLKLPVRRHISGAATSDDSVVIYELVPRTAGDLRKRAEAAAAAPKDALYDAMIADDIIREPPPVELDPVLNAERN